VSGVDAPDPSPAPGCSRRALLRSLGTAGVVLAPGVLLTGCGATGGSGGGDGGGDGSAVKGGTLAASKVPVGTAVVVALPDSGGTVVLAQPTAGSYVGFSAVCTHQGGIVAADSGTVVRCPLHGSEFDAAKAGDPVHGPATRPLDSVTVTVQGDQLVIA
jgi:Rieske Fe-S protein